MAEKLVNQRRKRVIGGKKKKTLAVKKKASKKVSSKPSKSQESLELSKARGKRQLVWNRNSKIEHSEYYKLSGIGAGLLGLVFAYYASDSKIRVGSESLVALDSSNRNLASVAVVPVVVSDDSQARRPIEAIAASASGAGVEARVELPLGRALGRDVAPLDDQAFRTEFGQVQKMSLSDRLSFWSAYLEKNPGFLKKLVEWTKKEVVNDFVPLFPNQFDCTTFVETVVALARSEVASQVVKELVSIRYRDGNPSFHTRNHFVESDWIPNNERSQLLKDITREVAEASNSSLEFEAKRLDREAWVQAELKRLKRHRKLEGLTNQQMLELVGHASEEAVDVRMPYILLQDVPKALAHVASGTVVNLVHFPDGRYATLIRHQGILIRDTRGVWMLRHASHGGHVKTVSLLGYLKLSQSGAHGKSSWVGLNFNQINSSSSTKSFFREAM